MNFAFKTSFHYFCSIQKTDHENQLLISVNLTLTKGNAFAKPFYSEPSVLGSPGHVSELLIDSVDADTLQGISDGVVSEWLVELIKKFTAEQHIKLVNELLNSKQLNEAEQIAVIQQIVHFLCTQENSFGITISIEKNLLTGLREESHRSFSEKKKNNKALGYFFGVSEKAGPIENIEWWVKNFGGYSGLYVARQVAIDVKSLEADLINNILNKDIFLIGRVFLSLIRNEFIYRNQDGNENELLCRDKLTSFIGGWLPKEITISDAYRFVSEVTGELEFLWNRWSLGAAKLTVGTWFAKSAESALFSLQSSDKLDAITDSIRLLSYSEVFPNLTDDFHARLSELLIISAKAERVSLLLPYFLDNFRYKDHQLKTVCALVNENFEKIEDMPSGTLRVIAALYFYGTTKTYFENGLNTSVFEYDPDYLEISRKINSGAKNYQSSSIDKLKKILKLGEYNKVLFILFHVHLYLNDESIQGELIRLYTKCHMVVSNGVRWEGIWIFGKTLNDIDLLESFALKLLDVSATKSAEKVIQHIKLIEPYSECLTRLQTRLSRSKAIELLKNEGVKFENIQSLSGIEFENLVQSRFEKFQLKVSKTPVSGDFGADLIVDDDDGTRYIIQCKRFAAKVNLKAVQEVVAAKSHYGGDYGIVITNNEFLTSAIELAKSNQIELWNGDKLLRFLSGDLGFSALFDVVGGGEHVGGSSA